MDSLPAVPGYRLESKVASGATAVVYRAVHLETQDTVAVKILHPHLRGDDVSELRFTREFEVGSSLQHEHIAKTYAQGVTDSGASFLAMDFLDGKSLQDRLQESRLSLGLCLRVFAQICLALEHAHQHGVIHRDLKPGNIMLCGRASNPTVKVFDFGAVKLQIELGARITNIGTTLGSPSYMSPEQAMGKRDIDHRSDVFSLSSLIYEMMTGTQAFGGKRLDILVNSVLNEEPVEATVLQEDLPVAIDEVLSRAWRKEKTERIGSVREFGEAVLAVFPLKGSKLEEVAEQPAPLIQKQVSSVRKMRGSSLPPTNWVRDSLIPAKIGLEKSTEALLARSQTLGLSRRQSIAFWIACASIILLTIVAIFVFA